MIVIVLCFADDFSFDKPPWPQALSIIPKLEFQTPKSIKSSLIILKKEVSLWKEWGHSPSFSWWQFYILYGHCNLCFYHLTGFLQACVFPSLFFLEPFYIMLSTFVCSGFNHELRWDSYIRSQLIFTFSTFSKKNYVLPAVDLDLRWT